MVLGVVTRPLRKAYERAMEPVTYGFPVGRIRVLEGRLLSLGRLERLIEARDFAEQRRILTETDYGELFADARTSSEAEDALDAALERAYDFMEESRLPEPIIEFFRIRYDFLNLRILLKLKLAGGPKPERWSVHGTVPFEVFEKAAETADDWTKGLPGRLGDLARTITELLSSEEGEAEPAGVRAADIDAMLDKALYERIGQISYDQPSEWFVTLGRLMIDLANLRIVLRARRFGKEERWLSSVLIEGGNVPTEIVRENAFGPLEELQEELSSLLGGVPHMREALERAVVEPDKLDVITDDVILGMAKTGQRKTTGPEPIVSYLLALENEIKLLRIVLLGKLANVPSERIHERVRELYV